MRSCRERTGLVLIMGISLLLSGGCGEEAAVTSDRAPGAGTDAEVVWLTDFPQALEQAKTQDRSVLLEFTGSDWCPPCIALHNEVLSKSTFAGYVEDSVVPVKLDFPNDKSGQSEALQQANVELRDRFEVRAYPTVVLLDAEGNELSRLVGYNSGAQERWLNWLDESLPAEG